MAAATPNDGWEDVDPKAAAPDDGWEDVAPPAPAKAPTPPPATPFFTMPKDVVAHLTSPQAWADAGKQASVNQLEGMSLNTGHSLLPYIQAGLDTVGDTALNVLRPGEGATDTTFRDRLKNRQKEWAQNLDPALTAAASAPLLLAGGAMSELPGLAATNVAMNAGEADKEGKDLTNPETAANVLQTSAWQTMLPHFMGETGGLIAKDIAEGPGAKITGGANWLAGKASGLRAGDLKRLSADKDLQTVGAALRDKGIIKPGLIFRTPESPGTMLPKVQEAMKGSGEDMGRVLSEANTATGGSGAEIRGQVGAKTAAAEDARTGAKNDLLFEAGKHDQQLAQHANDAQDFVADTGNDIAKTFEGTLAGKGGATSAATEQRFRQQVQDAAKERLAADPATLNRVEGGNDLNEVAPKKRIGAAEDAVPAVEPRQMTEGLGFNGHEFVDRARRELLSQTEDPALKDLQPKIKRLLDLYEQRANRGLSFSEANQLKTNLQRRISDFRSQGKITQASLRTDMQRMLDDAIEGQMKSTVGDQSFRDFVKAKSDYGNLAEAAKGLDAADTRLQGNNPFGLSEMLGGLGGMGGAGLGGAGVGAVGVRAARTLGLSGLAQRAAAIDNIVQAFPRLMATQPTLFGQWGNILRRAHDKGPEAMRQALEHVASMDPKIDAALGGGQ